MNVIRWFVMACVLSGVVQVVLMGFERVWPSR